MNKENTNKIQLRAARAAWAAAWARSQDSTLSRRVREIEWKNAEAHREHYKGLLNS